jgi:hypothetical protein
MTEIGRGNEQSMKCLKNKLKSLDLDNNYLSGECVVEEKDSLN